MSSPNPSMFPPEPGFTCTSKAASVSCFTVRMRPVAGAASNWQSRAAVRVAVKWTLRSVANTV